MKGTSNKRQHASADGSGESSAPTDLDTLCSPNSSNHKPALHASDKAGRNSTAAPQASQTSESAPAGLKNGSPRHIPKSPPFPGQGHTLSHASCHGQHAIATDTFANPSPHCTANPDVTDLAHVRDVSGEDHAELNSSLPTKSNACSCTSTPSPDTSGTSHSNSTAASSHVGSPRLTSPPQGSAGAIALPPMKAEDLQDTGDTAALQSLRAYATPKSVSTGGNGIAAISSDDSSTFDQANAKGNARWSPGSVSSAAPALSTSDCSVAKLGTTLHLDQQPEPGSADAKGLLRLPEVCFPHLHSAPAVCCLCIAASATCCLCTAASAK